MNFELYTDLDGAKRARFENGFEPYIYKDEKGVEYTSIPNLTWRYKPNLFYDCITDAIDSIRRGDGDALQIGVMGGWHAGRAENVIHYLDRDYGEDTRQRSIEFLQDVICGYSLKFGYHDSMVSAVYVGEGGKATSYDSMDKPHVFFRTKEEAEVYRNELLSDAQDSLVSHRGKSANPFTIRAFSIPPVSIVARIGQAMALDNNWKLEIVQALQPEKHKLFKG